MRLKFCSSANENPAKLQDIHFHHYSKKRCGPKNFEFGRTKMKKVKFFEFGRVKKSEKRKTFEFGRAKIKEVKNFEFGYFYPILSLPDVFFNLNFQTLFVFF